MKRELPIGPAENRLEVVGRDEPTEFAIRTTSGPTPFVYRYQRSEDEDGTDVQLDAQVELGGDNLQALKRLLESRAPGPSR